MKGHNKKATEAYRLLSHEEKMALKKEAEIEANKWGLIENEERRRSTQDELLASLQCTIDELESKCGFDALVISSPRHGPGIIYTCSSRAHYAAAILSRTDFPKKFISACDENINRLPQFNKQSLRELIRKKMHILMSESKQFII
jgi:hypothetical protein